MLMKLLWNNDLEIRGDSLPSIRYLAKQLDITSNTVARAYMELERKCMILSNGRKGSFVNSELRFESKAEIVVDIGHNLLHKLFHPTLEIISSIVYIGFMLILDLDFHIAFIHILLLWFLYLTIRSVKYQVRPSLKDGYLYSFIFMSINNLLIIYYLVRALSDASPLSVVLLMSGGNFHHNSKATQTTARCGLRRMSLPEREEPDPSPQLQL